MEKKWQPTLITTDETMLHTSLLTPPSEGQRLTPTGKISHAKTRVYTQRYRKEWEQMSDFKGWLTSVPLQPTRAYCLYCKKNLHAHRLSLLKHTCTMKHQRAALVHQVEEQKKAAWKMENVEERDSENVETIEQTQVELEDNDDDNVEYVIERLDSDNELEEIQKHSTEDTINKVGEDEEDDDDDEEEGGIEETLQISDDDNNKRRRKKVKVENMRFCEDYTETIEQAEYLDDSNNHGNVELEMVVESEDLNNQDEPSILSDMDESHKKLLKIANENEGTTQGADSQTEKKLEENKTKESGMMMSCSLPIVETHQINASSANTPIGVLQPVNTTANTPAQNKTITLTTGSKTLTLTGGTFQPGAQFILSKIKGKLPMLVMADKKNIAAANQTENTLKPVQIIKEQPVVASTSYQNKKHVLLKTVKNSVTKKPRVSTHVMDTSKGLPVGGLQVSLYKLMDGRWTFLNESNTSANGRCIDLVDNMKVNFTAGRYKIHFDVDKYFTLRRIETMYPFIEIVFDVKNPAGHYHIPVLLSPFGYTTYRGSER